MESNNYSACACMGPMYGDPHCYCVMKGMGLKPNKKYEWTAKEKQDLNAALDKMVGWSEKACTKLKK